jgi:hypothetical protein
VYAVSGQAVNSQFANLHIIIISTAFFPQKQIFACVENNDCKNYSLGRTL